MRTLKDVLLTPTAKLGRFGRFLAFQYRLWSHCLRLLNKNNAAQLAAALSYYTIFGIVPLAIVVVLIFHSIPAYRQTGEQLKRIIYSELRLTRIEYPNPDNPEERVVLTTYLDEIIDRFFAGLDKSSLGLISAVLVIWAAIRLLSLIESAFNHMWYVPRGRRFLHRVINYWALLTLVPLLLGVGLYATTQYTILERIETGVLTALSPFISYMVSMLTFFLLYLVMPNAKVQAAAAIWGATVAALVWSFARWGFGVYVMRLIPYSAMYGVLGLIPLAVFWIYVTWFIVLFGLELTFATQHFETLEAAEVPKAQEVEGRFIANDMTSIAVVREIAAAFESGRAPISTEDLCSRLDIPGEFGQKLLEELVDRGLLAKASEPKAGYLPAKDPEHITLSDITDAVAAASFAQPRIDEHGNLHQIMQAQRTLLAHHNLKEIIDAQSAHQEPLPSRAGSLTEVGPHEGATSDPSNP
jgi:YihY family inner membrane protein